MTMKIAPGNRLFSGSAEASVSHGGALTLENGQRSRKTVSGYSLNIFEWNQSVTEGGSVIKPDRTLYPNHAAFSENMNRTFNKKIIIINYLKFSIANENKTCTFALCCNLFGPVK